ncbi:MAG: MBL fold metallo-hydrolase [Erysipelotrichaceae bacterium]|nr:MBL fold metallo-hydrolase [Erysipelotrichaceae bacterium]
MDITTFVMGPIATNTYLLTEGKEAILIDPASRADKVIEKLGDLDLKAVLLTHGHFDHIKACDGLYDKYHCPIYLNTADEQLARDKHSGAGFGLVAYISCPIVPLKEGKMEIGPFHFEVIFTPGHTPGSVIFVFENHIFTGDTLFRGSVGRTDLKGGDAGTLKESLRIFKGFDKEYFILPGHDDPSTLSFELANNWFLR